jgi:hypothetical protein
MHPLAIAPRASIPLSFTRVCSWRWGSEGRVQLAEGDALPNESLGIERKVFIFGRARGSISDGANEQATLSRVSAAVGELLRGKATRVGEKG